MKIKKHMYVWDVWVQIWLVSMVVMSQICGLMPISKDSVLASNNTKPLRCSRSKGPFWEVLRSVNVTLNGAQCMMVFSSFINLFFVINFGGTFITDPDDQQDVAVFLHLSSERKQLQWLTWGGVLINIDKHLENRRLDSTIFVSRSSFGDAGLLDFGRCGRGPTKSGSWSSSKTKHWDLNGGAILVLLREWSRITPQKMQRRPWKGTFCSTGT